MAWYAYCIGEKQAFPALARHRKPVPMESVLGVSGNQVFLYPASDLAVIVSEHNPNEALNQKAGVDHARVIADCFQHSTVLPFRFGTVFNDDEFLRKSIRSNQRQFLGNIDKLRGKTEMHLKIFVASLWDWFSPPLSEVERDPKYTGNKLRWDRCKHILYRSMLDLTASKLANVSMDTQNSPHIWQALRISTSAEITKRRGSG